MFAFEGPDGVGKTTLVKAVGIRLREAGHEVEDGAFPGNTPHTLGRLVYDLHHEPSRFGLSQLPTESLQMLHVAAHLEAISGWIKNARSSEAVVLLDRFWWSTAAYGAVAGLTQEMITAILEPELLYWRREPPDGVFLVERCCSRFVDKGDLDTAQRLTSEYDRLAASESQKAKVIRTTNNGPIDEVAAVVIKQIELSLA